MKMGSIKERDRDRDRHRQTDGQTEDHKYIIFMQRPYISLRIEDIDHTTVSLPIMSDIDSTIAFRQWTVTTLETNLKTTTLQANRPPTHNNHNPLLYLQLESMSLVRPVQSHQTVLLLYRHPLDSHHPASQCPQLHTQSHLHMEPKHNTQ